MTFKLPQAVSEYPRKSILTPLLWLNGITFPTGAAAFMYSWRQGAVLLAISVVTVVATLWYYRYWSRIDPDRLQTEDYRIQKEVVGRLVSYVDGKEIILEPHQRVLSGSALPSEDRQ